MSRRVRRTAIAIAAIAAACAGVPAAAQYRITASVSLDAPQVRGTVELQFTNRAAQPLSELLVIAFPNRFARAASDVGINDFNRPFVYPRQEFRRGAMVLDDIAVDGAAALAESRAVAELPPGTVIAVALAAPLAPGKTAVVRLTFRTTIPERFGTFGQFEDMLTALGGWYPYVPAQRDDGSWALDVLPPAADFTVWLEHASAGVPPLQLILNGQRATGSLHADIHGVHYLTLVAAPRLESESIATDGASVEYVRRPPRRTQRIAPGPTPEEITAQALRALIARRPAGVPAPRVPLVVVEAPLRLDLTAPGEGMVVISDRSFKVHELLRPFHAAQVAQAVYAELLRAQVAPREPPGDFVWVSEGLSHILAHRYLQRQQPDVRTVQDWIDLFDMFAIVDRFETAPKIPFVAAFFERTTSADELHERIETFNRELPPGHVIIGKLQQQIGDDALAEVIDRCLVSPTPFRQCAAHTSGADLTEFFVQWLQPYPAINYDFAAVDLNEARDDHFRSAVIVRRRSSRPIHEPVDVRLQSIGGRFVDVRWEDGTVGVEVPDAAPAALQVVTPFHVHRAIIDPDHRLIETTRADNARPPIPQVVVDSAEVEVSSTEFGFSGLVVGRRRYDYRQDLALAGFYSNRSVGADAGARYHWGTQNDPTLYRHNIYGFYSLQALDAGFRDHQHPQVRTAGHLNGIGVRYDYNSVFAYDNPTGAADLRLFADWYEPAFGSSFNYADWGGSAVLTHPLWTPRTVLAGQVLNGFSEPLGGSRVPNQGLFSLGGSRSIRGIGAEEELGRNIFLLRGEVRQAIYPELDLNLLDVVVLRRTQVRVFVDTGHVDNSAGRIYSPNGFAVGAGVGFAGVYEFMGFFPSVFYIELATRVDRANSLGDVQVLFGTRQPF